MRPTPQASSVASSRLHLPDLVPPKLHQNQAILPKVPPTFINLVSEFMEQPLHLDTPDIDEVLSAPFSLSTHIPQAAQEAWAQCFLAVLSGIVSLPTTIPGLGETRCPFRSWCFDGSAETHSTASSPPQRLAPTRTIGRKIYRLRTHPNANQIPRALRRRQQLPETKRVGSCPGEGLPSVQGAVAAMAQAISVRPRVHELFLNLLSVRRRSWWWCAIRTLLSGLLWSQQVTNGWRGRREEEEMGYIT